MRRAVESESLIRCVFHTTIPPPLQAAMDLINFMAMSDGL